MAVQISRQIELLTNTIAKKIGAKQIIVFGSYAHGNSDKDSDLDLCVIIDLKDKRKIDIIREIRQELIDLISSPLDILVYSEKEFNERARLKNTLEHKIMKDGMRVYAE